MGFSAADPKHVVPNDKKGEKEEQENKHFVRIMTEIYNSFQAIL